MRGRVDDLIALNVDLAPTILDLAGVPQPEGVQGESLKPRLDGRFLEAARTDFLYEHHFKHARIPKSEGVRGQRYVYARFYEQDPVHEWLFDLQEDPLQQHNLAQSPEHKALLERSRARLQELIEAAR